VLGTEAVPDRLEFASRANLSHPPPTIQAMYKEPDIRVAHLASGQNGVVLRSQALAVGLTPRMLSRRLASGALVVVKPGVYVLPGNVLSPRLLLQAATSALPAVVSHESAAAIHGLPYVARGLLVVTVPHRMTHFYPEITVHQSTDLHAEFVEEVDGLRVTTVPRTIFDLAASMRPQRLRMLIEQSVIDRSCTLDGLAAVGDRLARRGRPGSAIFRTVLNEIGPGLAQSESVLEVRAIALLREAGLPDPVQQYPIPWREARNGRSDLAYPSARVLIELDGRRWHSRSDSIEMDQKRDRSAQLAGWRVFRFTWNQLDDGTDDLVATVQRVLAEAVAC
jgi:Transcriptional regulator, AbiEi antitoxin/Protein of unknown function (DUF559)